jgi:hypothetical protein
MSPSSMVKADFVSSLVFFILGVYMIVEGLNMPGAGGFIEAGGEPGKVPVLLGAIIAFFAVIMLFRSVAGRGYQLWEGDQDWPTNWAGLFRSLATATICCVYAIGLVGATLFGWKVPYFLATLLFVFVFIVIFEWEAAPELGQARWQSLSANRSSLVGFLKRNFGWIGAHQAPYVWLIATALLQAVLVTWAVTYLFEQQFFVTLP